TARPAAVDVGALVRRREDLGHRSGLLVRRPTRGRLGEHRLAERMGVALLLTRTQPAVVALTDRLDRGRQTEDDLLALAVGSATAAGVEQARVERRSSAVAVVLTAGERGVAVAEWGKTGDGLAVDDQLR